MADTPTFHEHRHSAPQPPPATGPPAPTQQHLRLLKVCEEQAEGKPVPEVNRRIEISADDLAHVRDNEEFLKQMFSSPYFRSIRNTECNPWPSDFKSLLISEELPKKRSLPKTKDAQLEECLKVLKETSETLEQLKQECSFFHSDAAPDDTYTVVQALKLAVSDFLMLMSAFSQVYESEFQAHCKRPTPLISDCGPLFQAVHQSLSTCCEELQAIIQVSQTSKRIVDAVQRRQEDKQLWGGSSLMTLASKLEQLRQRYERFHVALRGGGKDLS